MKIKKISIIMPVYNEANSIEEIVNKVCAADTLGLEKEIILVDDGSVDGTRDLITRMKSKQVKIILHKKNQGKGGALITGFSAATGDIVLIQDADLEYDPDEYPLLINPIINGHADVVFGSRFLTTRPHRVLYYWHSVGNNFITWVSNMCTGLNLTDMETCYKVFTREALQGILPKLSSKRFGIEPEMTAYIAAHRPRLRVYEVGISYSGRTYEEGKKIGWKDGAEAIYCIIKYNLFK